jgi:hypothetical protein
MAEPPKGRCRGTGRPGDPARARQARRKVQPPQGRPARPRPEPRIHGIAQNASALVLSKAFIQRL